MSKIDRRRKIEKIISLVNGMVLLEKSYRPETWEGLLNVIDHNHEKFDVIYVPDAPQKVTDEEGNTTTVWREDQLKSMNFKQLNKVAKGMGIDTSNMPRTEDIKNAILGHQEKASSCTRPIQGL